MMNGNSYSLADIAAATGGSNNRGNNDGWGGDGWGWIWILLIFCVFGGWGNGFGGFGGMGGGAYPTEAILQRSLDTQSIIGKLDGINQGLCDGFYAQSQAVNGLGMNMMQGFHGVDNAICNLGYNVQQGFNTTNVALMQGQNALQTQLSDCCCKNQVGQMQIQNQMQADTCALQNTMNTNTRDTIDNANSGIRAIMDKLCQMEYNGLNDKYQAALAENQSLRTAQNIYQQNAYLTAAMDANTANIIRRTGSDCPIPAYVVPNPNCCYDNYGFGYRNNGGCGCNSGCGCA